MTGPPEWRSPVEQSIAEAQARGEFDDLPGKGQPLPAGARGESWRLEQYALRESSNRPFLPAALLLRKEFHDIPARIATMHGEPAVRDYLTDLEARIRAEIRTPTSSISLALPHIDIDAVVTAWHEDRRATQSGKPGGVPPAPQPAQARRRRLRRRPR